MRQQVYAAIGKVKRTRLTSPAGRKVYCFPRFRTAHFGAAHYFAPTELCV